MTTPRHPSEEVLRWLNQHTQSVTFSIGTIAQDTGLDRRQVTSALHNLADGALEDDLQRVGRGMWRLITAVEESPNRETIELVYKTRDDLRPGDVLGGGTVLAVYRTAYGTDYLVGDEHGGRWRIVPIYEIESEVPTKLLPPPGGKASP